MTIDDQTTWTQVAEAIRSTFDSVRAAIGVLKDIQSLGGGRQEQQKVVDDALDKATSAAAVAEAQIAKALDYELCRCEFPPTAMLTVGYRANGSDSPKPVYECPKCYSRIAPVEPKGYEGLPPSPPQLAMEHRSARHVSHGN